MKIFFHLPKAYTVIIIMLGVSINIKIVIRIFSNKVLAKNTYFEYTVDNKKVEQL